MYTRQNVVVSFVLAISMVGISYGADGVLPGDGLSESTAYQIEDLADFDVFADQANAATYWSSGVYTKLACDPNLTGRSYTTAVIAPDTSSSSSGFQGTPFEAVFDGNGHIIRNLTIDTAGAGNDYLGLFGQIEDSSAAVKNLSIENINITGGTDSGFLGGLCGQNGDWDNPGGTITNCYATGSVTGSISSFHLGGLCGFNRYGTITDCYATGLVTGGYGSFFLGGLCGVNYGTITNCYAAGSVTGGDHSDILGGLCGWNGNDGTISNCYATGAVIGGDGSHNLGSLCGYNLEGTITNCYATGSVTGGFDSHSLGGLCGYNYYGTITNSYATGSVIGEGHSGTFGGLCGNNDYGTITNCHATGPVISGAGLGFFGGLCGFNNGTISDCYAAGSVTSGDYSCGLGGLCGNNYGTITNCYATGSVTGGDYSAFLGGLCGHNLEGIITNCYSGGSVTGEDNLISLGGLCGHNDDGTISNCFWDVETSGMTDGVGNQDPDPAGVIGKTTVQMQTESTFTDANWDFTVVPVWHMPFQATGYPMLGWQKDVPGDFTGRYGVYMDDFAILSNAWLSTDTPTANWNEHCDLNANGVIDPGDLKTFAEHWLCK
ncbi:MAG: hypothetical protein KAJ52_01150 [Sedimentisphaerales bacterium]|nr:hypothetical protein [Sedimentisphaerales bacterium]